MLSAVALVALNTRVSCSSAAAEGHGREATSTENPVTRVLFNVDSKMIN